jgi:hypothetical protein
LCLLAKQFSSGVTLSPFGAGLPARKTDYRAACTGIALFWVSLFNWKGAKYRLRDIKRHNLKNIQSSAAASGHLAALSAIMVRYGYYGAATVHATA